ncbi:MAG: sensor histidine kinase [Myxococcales bacterium]
MSEGSPAASRLLARQSEILHRWEQKLRAIVPAAAEQPHPILINTMPELLRQLAEALSPDHPRRIATEGSSIAEEHGSERVRLTQYRLEDLITEYRLLREVVLEVLRETGPVDAADADRLHASIDLAITRACTAYTLVEDNLREQLFATLAHDLRGPLGAAKVSASLVLRRPGSEEVPRWAARAVENIDRADRMLQDLLDAMRLQAGGRLPLELEPCDLLEIVHAAVEQTAAQHGERFVIIATEPVQGWFARDPLRRAVENLANNAVKYGSGTRPVTLSVTGKHGRARIRVHNHGGYIPPEQQALLFRAFQRLPSAEAGGQRGWGLGLAQVRGVAEAHGGSIGVDSLPDQGTSFTIDIPCDARPYQHTPTTSTVGIPSGSGD